MIRYRLRVSLVGSEPQISRTFDIRENAKMLDLHMALQVIMGWRESHMHGFTDGDPIAMSPQSARRWAPFGFGSEGEALPEEEFTVGDALNSGGPLWYEYDFSDGWTHRLDIVEALPDEPYLPLVVLVDGANRGPFEDSGGVDGYAEKLAIVADPQHPEHESIVDWINATVGPWVQASPSRFNPVGVQSELNLLFNAVESGLEPYDMSGIVKVEAHRRPGDVNEDSPIAVFVSQLPPPVRSELRQHLYGCGVLDQGEIDDATAARIIRPFAWLMEAVGVDSLALTSAEMLPPATVLDGMTKLGWIKDWIGKANREDLTPPIAHLRETAQRLGLIRVAKGSLELSVEAKNALGDPQRQLRLVARGLYRKLSDPEIDAAVLYLLSIVDGTEPTDRWRSVDYGLQMCGWRSSNGHRFSQNDIGQITFATQQVLNVIGNGGQSAERNPEDESLLEQFAHAALR